MKVLVACEFSGIVREAFKARGHDAWSCDLLPTEIPGNHIQGDVLQILDDGWDLMIAHPPCTDIAVSGARWFKEKGKEKQQRALEFFCKLLDAPILKKCVENPVSIASTQLIKPSQIIQPWQYGDSYQKTTCLWVQWLPLLKPTKIVDKGEFHITPSGKKVPKWYVDAGWKSNTGLLRSRTFPGIANAMSEQWG
jgi:hypothetical protein